MNFIKETDRFAKDLENWKKGHGYTNTEGLKDLMLIWHEFINIPERKAVTYPNVTAEMPLVDYNCGKCGPLTDALTLIYAWRNSKELQNEVYVDFKGVPQAVVVIEEPSDKAVWQKHVKIVIEEPKGDTKYLNPNGLGEKLVVKTNGMYEVSVAHTDYSKLKMHQLRSIAKKRGINYTNTTKAKELIEILKTIPQNNG